MQRLKYKKFSYIFFGLFMFCFIFLVTACGGKTTPTQDQPLPENLSAKPTEQVRDFPASIPIISTGQSLRFERISLEQGLSQSTVFCMLQDSQGFMWFGTEDGLNKYDGYNFTVYKNDPDNPNSLGGNWIHAILEDYEGILWIGTSDRGLDRYDRNLDQFTHFRYDPDDPSSLNHDEITSIYQSQDGVLWIGTDDGLNKFDRENQRFIHFQHDPVGSNSLSSNAVSTIFEDQEGILWIGTEDNGLNKFDRNNERWWNFENDPGNPFSLGHNSITSIFSDQAGVLWVGTSGGGLEKFDKETEQFIHYRMDPDDQQSLSSDEVEAIYQDREGILWIGTYTGGLNRYDPEKDIFIRYQNIPGNPHSVSSDIILSIYQDREGVLWAGTIGGGVNKLNMGWRNFALYQNDPDNSNSVSDNMVRAFYEEQDNAMWIGTMFGGIDRFDRESGKWRQYEHDPDNPDSLSNNFVSVIYKDQSNELWIGTASGLDRFSPVTETFAHFQANFWAPAGAPENNVRAIYESAKGKFWIGTKAGLYQFDLEENRWSQFDFTDYDDIHNLNSAWVFSFLADREGRLWISTYLDGLYVVDLETEEVSHYHDDPDDPSSLSSNLVNMGIQDPNGVLWFSTAGGLNRYDPETDTFSHYREKDGLPNESIYCVLGDAQGGFWLSTNKGISRFEPQSETFQNYEMTDGLQSNEFNGNACYLSESGEMFFGGINGFNTFFPDQVLDNSTIPPVILTSFTQNGEEVDLGIAVDSVTEITFKWPDNSFEFYFAALSYARPEKNQYAYMLEGFDKNWNEIGTRRFGKYTNLPGGTYTLRLRGSNNDGIWDEVGTAVKITIVPPFWETWWFRGVILIAMLGGIYGGYKLRVRTYKARSRELESKVKQRTDELLETQESLRQSELEKAITEERSRLARDLHDSVTQSLHSSTLMAEAGQRLASSGDIERAKGYLIRLGDISQQALKEMRLLVYELRPLALREVGLVGALHQRLDAVERRSGVEVQLSIEEELELPAEVEEQLFRVAMEALNNTLKHANPTKVTVALRKEEKRQMSCIELSISDDGKGFDPEAKDNKGGLGLVSMKERIEKLGGELTILSTQGEGTQVKACVNLEATPNSPDSQEE